MLAVSVSSTRCFLVLHRPPGDACFCNSEYSVYHLKQVVYVRAFKISVMWVQVSVVCLGRMRKSVQHLHRRVHTQPAGTYRPGDGCPDQPFQSLAGTATFTYKNVSSSQEVSRCVRSILC